MSHSTRWIRLSLLAGGVWILAAAYTIHPATALGVDLSNPDAMETEQAEFHETTPTATPELIHAAHAHIRCQGVTHWEAYTGGSPPPLSAYVSADWALERQFTTLHSGSDSDTELGGGDAVVEDLYSTPDEDHLYAWIYSYHEAEWSLVLLDARDEGHDWRNCEIS